MKFFKFTLLMVGILLFGSIQGQTLPKLNLQVQKGIGFGADPDLYRILDTNVIVISVDPGGYGNKVVSLSYVIKKDGQVINNLSDYGSVSLFLPGTSNYQPFFIFPDTTYEVLNAQGSIPSKEFCYNTYHGNYPDGLSLNLMATRSLRLSVVWKVPGSYTIEWELNERDSTFDAKGRPLTELVHLTTNIDEAFLTKKGAVILMDTMTMVLRKPEMTYQFPGTIDTYDSIVSPLDIKAYSYVDQKGFVAYRVEYADFNSSNYTLVSSGTGLYPYGSICIASTDAQGNEDFNYSTCLDKTGAFGASGNHAIGSLGKLDTLNNMVYTEMYKEGNYRMFLWMVHEYQGAYDTLVKDTVLFVVKKKIRPIVHFMPDVPVNLSIGSEFFGTVEFKANDFADTTGKISFVVKKDGQEIPAAQLAQYGYLQIGDKVLSDGRTAYPTNTTILLGRCDTTLRIDAKWSVTGNYTIEAYEDHYVNGAFRRHLAGDTLTLKVDGRRLPFLVLKPYMYPDTIINYTKGAYYWFDLMKENGWDYRREWVDLKYELAYSTDSLNWDTTTYSFDELGFMLVKPRLNGGSIEENDTLHYYTGMFPFTKVNGQDALIRLGALDTATRVDIHFKKAGFYRIVYSFEQWIYPYPGSGAGPLTNSFIGGQYRYNSIPVAWISHDTTIFHIKDSVLPKGELVPSVVNMGTDIDFHVGVRMDAGSYQYSNYTVPTYINYELAKKDANGNYNRVTNISDYGYFSMTYQGQTISGKGMGRIPQPHLSTYLLDALHNDTLHIDFMCKHDQAGDYSMRIQIMQFDTNRYQYPDTIRHGLLHDTTFYFTFDSLELPTLTVNPNNWDPYCVGAEYYHEITLRANGYANMISDIEYEIFRNGVPVTNVNDYATFHIGDRNITQGKGVIPFNPVKMGLMDTAIMSTVTWDSTGIYKVVYKLRGYVDGVQVVEFLCDTFTARVINRPLPFLVLYPYRYPDTVINYTKGAYYWFDLMKENGWEFRREYVDLHYDIAYSTDSLNWDTVGQVFDDHGYMIVVPKLNSPAGVVIPEYDTLHTWSGRFPMKDSLKNKLIRLGSLDTCTRVDIWFKKAGFYRIIYNFRQYNYPVMGPNSFVGDLSRHPEVRMIALLSHDTTIFHIKDSVLPSSELCPSVLHMGTEVKYTVGMRMESGSYQYSEYTVPVYINYELSKKDANGNYNTVNNIADYGYFSMSYDNKTISGKGKGRIPQPHLSTYLLDKLHNDTLHIEFQCKEGQAGDYAMRIQIIQFDTNRYRYPDTIRHGLLHDSIYYFTFEELERPTVTLDPDPTNEDCIIKGVDYSLDAIVDANDYKDSMVNIAYSVYFQGPNDNQPALITNISDFGKLSVAGAPITVGSGLLPVQPFALQQTQIFPVEMNWNEEGKYIFEYELKGYVNGVPVMSFYKDTFMIQVCEYELPEFVILPDPIYSNDSNGFGDNFDYHFVSRVSEGDLGHEPMWLITDWSFEDVNTGTITPISKLSDYNAAATITYKGATHTVVNGKDTLGNETLPLSFWTEENINPVLLFGNIGNYHLNMKLYIIRNGKAYAKLMDTTLVIRARDVDSVTFNTADIQMHVDTVDPYVTHVDSTFQIVFQTSDRYADTIDPYVSVDYRVIFMSLDSTRIDTLSGDFTKYGHLSMNWNNETLHFNNGEGSVPGDAVETSQYSSVRLRDILADTFDFVPNVHEMGYYTFEFVAREWRDTAGLPPYQLPNGVSVLTKDQSMQVATVSRVFSFTVEYRAKYPTVDVVATNEDSIIHTSFDIECGQEYKPGTVYTFDFICHPNSYPDSLGGLYYQVYKDGGRLLTAQELAACVDSLSFTFRNHTVNVTMPLGNMTTMFTGIDSIKLGRVYDPVTGDIIPITMTVRWKENASGNYMFTGLVYEYINGVRTTIDLASTTCYFVVKEAPMVTISTASILNDPTVRVINNDTNIYPTYDTLVFDINIDPKAYAEDYTSLDLTVYYQKDSVSAPVIVDSLSKIGVTADFVMDMLGRATVSPKTYVMDGVEAIPTAFSKDVTGTSGELNSLLLKYLGGNTIQFRPYLTEGGLYTFDFTLREWKDVSQQVAIENEMAGGKDGEICNDLWNGKIIIEIEEPTINVDPVFPQVTDYADSVDYPFFIKTTHGSYLYTDGYVHYKVYHMADSNGVTIDTAITDLGKYGKMNFIHPILGTMYYAPNSGEGTVPTLDTLYKLQTILTNIMWYAPGTYRIVYDLDIVPDSVDIPKAYDTLDMVVRGKIKPTFVISGFDSSFRYPTNIDQDFGLRLISNDYLFDFGAIFYCVYHNDTAIDENVLNSVYGDVNIDVANVDICGIPFDGNISMRSHGWLPGKRGGLDYFRLGIFDPAVMNINANFKEPGDYKIVFNLYLWDTTNSNVACVNPIGLVNAGAQGTPTIIITRDSLIIHVVDRPNVPVITVDPQPCDPNVAVPVSMEQVYDVNVTAGDYNDINATIYYEIMRNGVALSSIAPYGTMQVSKNGIVGQVTDASGFMNVGGVTNVPLSVLESSALQTILRFDSVGRYTMVYSIYGWGNTINAPAAYLSTDTITINVVDRVMPSTQSTLASVVRPVHALDTFKVYMHAAEYEYVMGRVAVKLYYSADSGKTLTPINNVSDFGSTSVLLNGKDLGYNRIVNTPFNSHMDTIPANRFVRLGAVAGVPVEVISQWDSVGTYVYTYEILQWDCYDSTKLDQTTYQHRPIYGEISQAGGHAVNVLYRDTIMIHVYPQYQNLEDAIELCADELPYQYNDQFVIPASFNKDASGATIQATVRDTLVVPMKTVHGLDSSISLDVQVHPVYMVTYNDTMLGLGNYSNHGFTENFTTQGLHVLRANLQTTNGCDSIVIDSVLVVPNYSNDTVVTICSDAMPFNWRNTMLLTPGSYADTLHTVYGADSIFTITLNVTPSYYYHDTIYVPMWNTSAVYSNIPTVNLPYTYAKHNGAYYVCDSVGDFVFNFKSVDGCDSIAYVNVKTYPMMYTLADLNGNRSNEQVLCYGDSVDLNINVDDTYGAVAVKYAFANTNPNIGLATVGIGSSTRFVALNNTNVPQEATLIMGVVVMHNGMRPVEVFESLTNKVVSTVMVGDSCLDVARPDTIHVTVMPLYEYFDTVTVCSSNLPYVWHDLNLMTSGNYDTTYTSAIGGCDSTYHLVLNVNYAYPYQTDHVEICASELPYEYNNSGRYITDAILANAVPGITITDTVVFNFNTVEGCDSIIHVGVTVHPLFTTTMRDTVCGFGSYTKNGFNETFTEAGMNVIRRVDTTSFGCDSIIVDTVIVSLPFVQYDTITVCSSMLPYTWHGRSINALGTHYDSLVNRYGCDSVYVLTLISYPSYQNLFDNVELCASDIPYNYKNSGKFITATPRIQLALMLNQDAVDTFKFNYYTVHGCDSIVYVRALVHPSYMTTLPTDTACIGAYTNHGFNAYFTTPGIYPLSKSMKSSKGCDSTVNISVYVAPTHYTKVYESICAGVPYMNHGLSFVQDTAGTYALRFNGKNSKGCDSIIDVVLTVYPSYSKPSAWTHLYPSVCRGETYSQNGFYVATRNLPANKHVHNDTNVYRTVNGCDSVVHLQLTINDSVVTRFAASICLGDRYTLNGFSVQPTAAGVFEYKNIRKSSTGCDSTAILTLTVNQVYNTTYYDEVCEGEHYQKYGFNTIVTANGTRLTHNYNTQRPSGCDSIVTVVLTVRPKSVSPVINDYICREEGVYNKNGFRVVLPAGLNSIMVKDTLRNAYGCDSISTLHLTIYDGKDTAIIASACEGERYATYGFDTTIYVPGVYHFKHSLKTVHGCDSNITLTLTVKPVYTSYESVDICQGDSVNYGGKFYQAGTHKIVYAHSAACCDSTLYLTVNANPLVRETQNVRICRNAQSTYMFNGKNLSQSGVYYDTIPFNGCYKIITLNLTFLDTASRPTYINGPMNIYTAGTYNYTCDTVPYNVAAGIPAVDAYLWETSDTTWTVVSSNMNTANIDIPKPGSGFIYVSAHNECGYSSKASLKVFAKVSVEDADAENCEVSIFPNPTSAEYSIRINGMEGNTQISIADMTGKIIFREDVEVSAMDNTFHYNADNYPKGIYLISVFNGNRTVVKKLVVQ